MSSTKSFAIGLSVGVATVMVAALALGASARNSAGESDASELAEVRVVNLAHENNPETTSLYPGDPPFVLETPFTVEEHGFYMHYVKEGEHTGTHWAAPCHFHAGAACADDLSPRDLYLPAVVVDVRAKARRNPDYEVTIDDLRNFESRYGRIPHNAAVIAWTGWARKWGTPAYYGFDAEGNMHQPGFSIAAVRWLLHTGRIEQRGALGTDTFGPDPATDVNFRASSLILQRHRIDLENLTNLDEMPPTGAYILVGGPINDRGSGSTATIWGLVPES